jgi:hypothetical protein
MGLREPAGSLALAARVAEWQRTGIRPPVVVWTAARTAQFLNAICGDRLYAAYSLVATDECTGGRRVGRQEKGWPR